MVKKYQRLVGHIVFRMISNQGDREDISQEVFLKVYKSLANFRGDAKLSTWIGRIAYNHCVDNLSRKNIPISDGDFDEVVNYISDERSSPANDAEAGEISSLLQIEIDRLPPQFRTIVTLYHLQEMTYAEIGEITNLPDGTVKSYLFRGRRLLKERIMSKYDREELWQ